MYKFLYEQPWLSVIVNKDRLFLYWTSCWGFLLEYLGLEATSFGRGTGLSHQAALDLVFARVNERNGKSMCDFITQQIAERLALIKSSM